MSDDKDNRWYWGDSKCPQPCMTCDEWQWDPDIGQWYTEMTLDEIEQNKDVH